MVLNIIVELVPGVNTILATPSKHHFYLPHVYSSKHNVYIGPNAWETTCRLQ